MSVLHVLLPPLQAGSDPALRRWLATGERLPGVPDSRDATVRGMFRFAGAGIPVAALRHHVHADDAGTGSWVCADPAYVRSEATGARLMACPVGDLSATEADELWMALRPLFGDMGVPLTVDTPSAWCVHPADGAPAATFAKPDDALGAGLIECLPEGDAGRKWRRLFNEAQIALHAHPVNAARAAAGKLPVNALWFWGSGSLPGSVETDLRNVASGDDAILGLAKIAGVVSAEPSPTALDTADGDTLLDLDVADPEDIAGSWLPSFRRWLRERHFGAIELNFPGAGRYRLRHAHRLRFWRRA